MERSNDAVKVALRDSFVPKYVWRYTLENLGRVDLRDKLSENLGIVFWTDSKLSREKYIEAKKVYFTAAKEIVLLGNHTRIYGLAHILEGLKNREPYFTDSLSRLECIFIPDFYEFSSNPMDGYTALKVRTLFRSLMVDNDTRVYPLIFGKPENAEWYSKAFLYELINDNIVYSLG